MFIINLFRYIFGYVNICLSGDFCERLLNICAKNHIALWSIKREKDDIYANISIKNFKKLKLIRGKSRVHVKISGKFGLPFILKKYKIRWGIPVGIGMFFIVLIFMQSFVWQIYFVGNEKISEKELVSATKKMGICMGIPIKKINTLKNKDELLLELDGIAWASFNIEGCRLTVNINETVNNETNKSISSNIYAKTDCVIKDIEVKSGILKVKKGDAVLKGDLLVSGVVELPNAGIREYVKSSATILGETNRTFITKINKEQRKLTKIQNKNKKIVINFFGIVIPLYLGNEKPPFSFETIENNFILFGEKIPIGYKTKIFQKYEYKLSKIDYDTAKNIAYKKIDEVTSNENYKSTKLLNEEFFEENNYFVLKREYKCEENIGYEEIFDENNLK